MPETNCRGWKGTDSQRIREFAVRHSNDGPDTLASLVMSCQVIMVKPVISGVSNQAEIPPLALLSMATRSVNRLASVVGGVSRFLGSEAGKSLHNKHLSRLSLYFPLSLSPSSASPRQHLLHASSTYLALLTGLRRKKASVGDDALFGYCTCSVSIR